VTNRTGAEPKQQNKQQNPTPAFAGTPSFAGKLSPPWRRSRPGKADRCERRVKSPGIRPDGRQMRVYQPADAEPAVPVQDADLAFQNAMRRAIAQGLERPPCIGVVKDHRPLNVPRLFEPAPHASGCTSPAAECADLIARKV
jgi:hypothetical protein